MFSEPGISWGILKNKNSRFGKKIRQFKKKGDTESKLLQIPSFYSAGTIDFSIVPEYKCAFRREILPELSVLADRCAIL